MLKSLGFEVCSLSYLTTTSCFINMLSVSNYEYSQGDLLGHGAFALVFKGRRKRVSGLKKLKGCRFDVVRFIDFVLRILCGGRYLAF